MASATLTINLGGFQVTKTLDFVDDESLPGQAVVNGGSTDFELVLGAMTDPQVVDIRSSGGVTISLAGGVTDIPADPFFVTTDSEGTGMSSIFVSTPLGQSQTVKYRAAE